MKCRGIKILMLFFVFALKTIGVIKAEVLSSTYDAEIERAHLIGVLQKPKVKELSFKERLALARIVEGSKALSDIITYGSISKNGAAHYRLRQRIMSSPDLRNNLEETIRAINERVDENEALIKLGRKEETNYIVDLRKKDFPTWPTLTTEQEESLNQRLIDNMDPNNGSGMPIYLLFSSIIPFKSKSQGLEGLDEEERRAFTDLVKERSRITNNNTQLGALINVESYITAEVIVRANKTSETKETDYEEIKTEDDIPTTFKGEFSLFNRLFLAIGGGLSNTVIKKIVEDIKKYNILPFEHGNIYNNSDYTVKKLVALFRKYKKEGFDYDVSEDRLDFTAKLVSVSPEQEKDLRAILVQKFDTTSKNEELYTLEDYAGVGKYYSDLFSEYNDEWGDDGEVKLHIVTTSSASDYKGKTANQVVQEFSHDQYQKTMFIGIHYLIQDDGIYFRWTIRYSTDIDYLDNFATNNYRNIVESYYSEKNYFGFQDQVLGYFSKWANVAIDFLKEIKVPTSWYDEEDDYFSPFLAGIWDQLLEEISGLLSLADLAKLGNDVISAVVNNLIKYLDNENYRQYVNDKTSEILSEISDFATSAWNALAELDISELAEDVKTRFYEIAEWLGDQIEKGVDGVLSITSIQAEYWTGRALLFIVACIVPISKIGAIAKLPAKIGKAAKVAGGAVFDLSGKFLDNLLLLLKDLKSRFLNLGRNISDIIDAAYASSSRRISRLATSQLNNITTVMGLYAKHALLWVLKQGTGATRTLYHASLSGGDNALSNYDKIDIKYLDEAFDIAKKIATNDGLSTFTRKFAGETGIIRKVDDVITFYVKKGADDTLTPIASLKDDILELTDEGLKGLNDVSGATIEKLADDIQIRGPNGDDLTGKVEWLTDGTKSWFRRVVNDFSQTLKSRLKSLGASDKLSDYKLATNSKGGALILDGVRVEAKEVALADEVFKLTNNKSIFPKSDLQAIEGFLDNGVPFTMKELEKDFGSFAKRINEMFTKIKTDPNFQWNGAEGYLKIPFTSFTKSNGTIQNVTREYVEQLFNAGISRNGFKIKNDGTIKNLTVFLSDGTAPFKLDLTKLK